MEAIKKIINVLPWIILIIAVTAIFAMVRYMGLEKENNIENNKKMIAALQEEAADLQAENADLQKAIDDLQAKTIDALQEKIVSLQSKVSFYQAQIDTYQDKSGEQQDYIDALSKQLKSVYSADQKALDALAKDLFMKACDKIAKTDYSTFPEFPNHRYYTDQPLEITKDGSEYKMKYDAFRWIKNEYYDIFTGELLDKVIDKRFFIKETKTGTCFYVKEVKKGATEWGVVNAELTRISETDNEIKYSVKYDRQEQGKITAKGLTCTMTIKYEEGRYRVSDTNLGNL